MYRLLEIPFLYRLSQIVLAPGQHHLMKPLYQKLFGASTGRVLDVGCGPKLSTPVPRGLLVGVDLNETYVKKYTDGTVDQDPGLVLTATPSRPLGFVASAEQLPFPDGSFDEARSYGLFHHLPDVTASKAVREMARCVRSGGRVVILDGIWPVKAWRRPLAWLIRRWDRGRFIRSQEQLLELIQEACPGFWDWERRLETYTGLECLSLLFVKK